MRFERCTVTPVDDRHAPSRRVFEHSRKDYQAMRYPSHAPVVKLSVLAIATFLSAFSAASAEEPAAGAAPELLPVAIGTPARLEVYPPTVRLDSNRDSRQLVVTGHYADGTTQDLTRAATITSANEQVAK